MRSAALVFGDLRQKFRPRNLKKTVEISVDFFFRRDIGHSVLLVNVKIGDETNLEVGIEPMKETGKKVSGNKPPPGTNAKLCQRI